MKVAEESSEFILSSAKKFFFLFFRETAPPFKQGIFFYKNIYLGVMGNELHKLQWDE